MAADHWFEDLADHMGPAYLRYSFTKGTGQEVAFLVEELGLEPGIARPPAWSEAADDLAAAE